MKKAKNAFAICARGERYIEYRNNLVEALKKYVPDADIVDIDPEKAKKYLPGIKEGELFTFSRLAIPLMPEFKGYNRVVWLDVDVDVVSDRFADIMDPSKVETSDDGLAAAMDINQEMYAEYISKRLPQWNNPLYYNAGVLVMDLKTIDRKKWRKNISDGIAEHVRSPLRWADQDIVNAYFDVWQMDEKFNWIWARGMDASNGAWLVHYCNSVGHQTLDEIIEVRKDCGGKLQSWKERCIVISPRHDFIRPWIRAYFATGNTIPLVIVPGPDGDWKDGDMEYCKAAADFCGGRILDCSSEWKDSARLAERAVKKSRVGWFTKKAILHAVATRLAPKSWAWIDDDAEVTGSLDECFVCAERAPGFIYSQFYRPDSIDNRHPASLYRSNIDTGDKVCWNSLVFFHGDANKRIADELGKDFPVEDDEIVFGHLYKSNPAWHEGFCDFSIRGWQKNCKLAKDIPSIWSGKLLHYTTTRNDGEVKKIWAAKAERLPKAPFETADASADKSGDADPVDAVFVIGTESFDNNKELRYALRSIAKNCKFVRDVYICGFCPSWVDRSKVKHLQWPDRFRHAKDANIIDKLRHACETPGIAKRILFCSDDQFQTKECTWDDFAPRYLRRYSSGDGWYEGRNRVWHSRLRKTLERDVQRRRSMGLNANDVFYYQPHIWMPIDRDRFIDYARWCGYENRDDTIIASGYYNFVDAKGRPDFDHTFIGGDESGVPNTTHIAYHDGSYEIAMKILESLFPEKCEFEKEEPVRTMRIPSPKPSNTSRQLPRPMRPEPVAKPGASSVQVSNGDDPSAAKPEETAEILDVTARIRENPAWHSLLGEVSRAEELRLFGVRGWRTVWRDIITRWRDATCNGTDFAPVESRRSEAAARVVNAYISNPDSMRTVRFGIQPGNIPEKVLFPVRQLPRPASVSERESLRDKVRSSLRGRGIQ